MKTSIIIWVDANVKSSDPDSKSTVKRLQSIFNEIHCVTEPDQCIQLLREFNGQRSFVITSGSYGQSLVPKIHEINNLDSIYIFCRDKKHECWAKEWRKIKAVRTEIMPICEELKKMVYQIEHDDISISFMKTSSDGSPHDHNQLEPSFMYTDLLKDTILEMNFTDQHIGKMVDSFLKRYKDDLEQQPLINKFRHEYRPQDAIWWYTHECFLYHEVNRALRELDGEIIIDMAFFIQHLHKQIESLYQFQLPGYDSKQFFVYRGQGITKENFKILQASKCSLLGFNCFLSTSIVEQVSLDFAKGGATREGYVGVLFIIKINPLLQVVPFADIRTCSRYEKEREILFSMNAIFKIGDLKSRAESKNIYEVSLELTRENDPILKELKEYMAEKTGCCEHRLGWILAEMGHYEKAEEIYSDLMKRKSSEHDEGLFNCQMAFIKDKQGQYDEAISYYENSNLILGKLLPENDPNIARNYNGMGLVFKHMEKYSDALKNYEKSLELYKTGSNVCRRIAMVYNNIGLVYNNLGEHSKALDSYEKTLEIFKETLPSEHPKFAMVYNNIGQVYDNMGDTSQAMINYEKSIKIRKKTLRRDHPDIANSYLNMGILYYRMRRYSKALENLEEALRINLLSFSKTHPYIGNVEKWIEKIKPEV